MKSGVSDNSVYSVHAFTNVVGPKMIVPDEGLSVFIRLIMVFYNGKAISSKF